MLTAKALRKWKMVWTDARYGLIICPISPLGIFVNQFCECSRKDSTLALETHTNFVQLRWCTKLQAAEGWRTLTGDFLAVSFCNTDWGSDDTQYSPGIDGNCGTCGMVVMRPTTRGQLLKCFLAMENGGNTLLFVDRY